jgi:C1A family cysteine protease
MPKAKRRNVKRAGATRAKHAFARPPARRQQQPGGQHYGWAPDLPDARDHRYAAPRLTALPATVSLRDAFPPPYSQGKIMSCAANAIASAIQFDRRKQHLPSRELTPSRLFIYYNARAIEGRVARNAPCQIRDAIKGVAKLGACFEGKAADQWPYVIARFKQKPRPACYKAALKDRAVHYSRIAQEIDHLKACLAAGYPFVFGFTAYESLEAALVSKTGAIPLPKPHEQALGGHVVLAVGYDEAKRQFTIRNSWGPKWGDGGYGTMPYDYVTRPRLANDFWTIRLMSPADGR